MANEATEQETTTTAGAPVQRVVSAISRSKAARFVEQQVDWKTEASAASQCPHYGACELREQLDHIYGGKPQAEEEKINLEGKGWR